MSPISDQELQRHLTRRTAKSLPADDREDVIAAVTAARSRPRFSFGMRPSLLLAPIAAIVLVIIVAVPLLWTLAPGPGPSSSPTSSSEGSSPPSPTAEATASPGPLDVLTQHQLIALAGDPLAAGRVVIADAQFAPVPSASEADCNVPDPCYAGQIGVNPGVVVFSGWRDASSEGTGTFYAPEGRWLDRLVPSSAYHEQLMAFRIGHESVEYLGTVQESGNSLVWSPDNVPAAGAAPDSIYAVDGWLVRTQQVPCPTSPPSTGGNLTDGNYECGGSFITGAPSAISESANDLDPGGLHVQAGAYETFAPNPTQIDVGLGPPAGTSDPAVYLVRFVGRRSTIMGPANVWRLVARLDPPMTATPTPTPAPTPTPTGLPITTVDDLAALTTDAGALGRVVLANAGIDTLTLAEPDPRCLEPGCVVGRLAGVTATVPVFVRAGEPVPTSLLGAFRVLDGALEVIGPVQLAPGSTAWSVPDLRSSQTSGGGVLYPVSAWLTMSPVVSSCPTPPDSSPDADLSYWCSGAWLTAERVDLPAPAAGQPEQVPPGALQVQNRAYTIFAYNTLAGEGGIEPWRDVYLVRQNGCPANVLGECPVWQMVDTLELTSPSDARMSCFNMAGTIDKAPITSQEMAQMANAVAVATVTRIGPAFWDSPTGERPMDFRGDAAILTQVHTSVETILKGNGHAAQRAVMDGGKVGCDSETWDASPKLVGGVRYVLFLNTRTYNNPDAIPDLFVQEAWPVQPDGTVEDPNTGQTIRLADLGTYLFPTPTAAPR
jgi:hypothetical protein